jgi:hypothetical protein
MADENKKSIAQKVTEWEHGYFKVCIKNGVDWYTRVLSMPNGVQALFHSFDSPGYQGKGTSPALFAWSEIYRALVRVEGLKPFDKLNREEKAQYEQEAIFYSQNIEDNRLYLWCIALYAIGAINQIIESKIAK